MGEGGMYDHLAGGFHRYSVTEDWHIPQYVCRYVVVIIICFIINISICVIVSLLL